MAYEVAVGNVGEHFARKYLIAPRGTPSATVALVPVWPDSVSVPSWDRRSPSSHTGSVEALLAVHSYVRSSIACRNKSRTHPQPNTARYLSLCIGGCGGCARYIYLPSFSGLRNDAQSGLRTIRECLQPAITALPKEGQVRISRRLEQVASPSF
jgi:hypothetical protein